jgi:hypothetical protein
MERHAVSTAAIDLITTALQEIGAYGAGDGAISASDSALCLRRLNAMMDSWSNETQACFCNLEQSVALVPGQMVYEIGPGAPDINGVRPIKIDQAYITDSTGNIFTLKCMSQFEWNQIGQRNVTSDVANVLFYDPQMPIGLINLYGIPADIGYTLTVDSYAQLQEFPSLTTQLNLPPGYELAISLNLALEIADSFGMTPSANLERRAAKAIGNVKRANKKLVRTSYDPEIVSQSSGSYNIWRDGYN